MIAATIPPTNNRRYVDAGHQPPHGRHCRGRIDTHNGYWPGTQRVRDIAARRRRNRRTLAAERAQLRRLAVMATRARRMIADLAQIDVSADEVSAALRGVAA